MDWYKAYQDGILRGSLCRTNDTTQLIWLKLLAIENETRLRDGWLHFAKGSPMPHDYLAMVCGVSIEAFEVALDEFRGDLDKDGHSRIEEADDGDIFIKNWEKYQAKPERIAAKEQAIEKRKRTNERKEIATDALIESANTANKLINKLDKKVRYIDNGDGTILDTKTGAILEEGVEKNE